MRYLTLFFAFCSTLFAQDFTVCSYNCGGLPDYYDYLRAVAMHNLLQERYNQEPEKMALFQEAQNLALRITFSEDRSAQIKWDQGEYEALLTDLLSDAANDQWYRKSQMTITPYNVRPVEIFDEETQEMLRAHASALTNGNEMGLDRLDSTIRAMGERIFQHELKYDIICLQEADYLLPSMFPPNYTLRICDRSQHSLNGIAWNHEKFEWLGQIKTDTIGRSIVALFKDLKSGKTVAVGSGHICGCNPFSTVIDQATGIADSDRGDVELEALIEALASSHAEIQVLGIDSNVTATHPRLKIVRDAGYAIDFQNYLYPTCTYPHGILNTRIDWIAVKSSGCNVEIQNIPVLGVGLNSYQTNMSDHRPIAAKIKRR